MASSYGNLVQYAAAASASLPSLANGTWTQQPAGAPSTIPVQSGLDNLSFTLRAEDATAPDQDNYCLTLLRPEAGLDFNTARIAADQAGSAGIGPRLLDYSDEHAALLFPQAAPWRVAAALDFEGTDRFAALLRQLRRWHATPLLGVAARPATADVSAVEQAYSTALPRIMTIWQSLRDWTARIAEALLSRAPAAVPLHRSLSLSTILIGPAADLLITDFHHSADGDPYADLAALGLQFCTFGDEWCAMIEQYGVAATSSQVAHVRLQAIVEDFRWGCWALLRHADTRAESVADFLSYGRMRLSRCHAHISQWDAAMLMTVL